MIDYVWEHFHTRSGYGSNLICLKPDKWNTMYKAQPITTLDLEHLLGLLKDHEHDVLALIDSDELLKKRENKDGLIIANASPKLFEPQLEHQLLAKGLVYTKKGDAFRFVSLPLVKMFNHGMREHSDATSRVLEQRSDSRLVFPEKLDGTMIQLFCFEGNLYLTTRSILEGSGLVEEVKYVGLARQVLDELYPQVVENPQWIEGLSLTFELIHPTTKQVTDYGVEQRLVLLAVYDHAQHMYWCNTRLQSWAAEHNIEAAKIIIEDNNLARGVQRLKKLLASDTSVPEGSIVCFERDDHVVHRVKVKTEEYLEQFAMRYHISYKSVVQSLWNRPELHDWDKFLADLIANDLSEEEVEAFYREYFDQFMVWLGEVKSAHQHVHQVYGEWCAEHGQAPDVNVDKEAHDAWFKQLALWTRAHHSEMTGKIMMLARRGEFSLEQMMWQMPAYSGFRGELQSIL